MKYNKLIRDKIPEIIKENGGAPVTHKASTKEYWEKLKKKLIEEIVEFSKDESKHEMADIFEVLYAIMHVKKWTPKMIEIVRKEKAKKRGSFKKMIILDEA